MIIHCGDICTPGTLKYILENFNKQIHIVFGNVEDILGLLIFQIGVYVLPFVFFFVIFRFFNQI